MPVSQHEPRRADRAGHRRPRVSANAEGDETLGRRPRRRRSGATIATTRLAIIRTLREPDPAMAAAGDVETWERMIEAALAEAERRS